MGSFKGPHKENSRFLNPFVLRLIRSHSAGKLCSHWSVRAFFPRTANELTGQQDMFYHIIKWLWHCNRSRCSFWIMPYDQRKCTRNHLNPNNFENKFMLCSQTSISTARIKLDQARLIRITNLLQIKCLMTIKPQMNKITVKFHDNQASIDFLKTLYPQKSI